MTPGQMDIYDMLKVDMSEWLRAVYDLSAASADPDKPFWYLGGPMTGLPKFNFPRFDEVAANLRARTWNVVSPAELDSPGDRAAALASTDGKESKSMEKTWTDFLERDVVICAMPNCIGGIFMEGWEDSSGANLETYVLSRLGKKLYRYHDNVPGVDSFVLTDLDRDAALEARVSELREVIA